MAKKPAASASSTSTSSKPSNTTTTTSAPQTSSKPASQSSSKPPAQPSSKPPPSLSSSSPPQDIALHVWTSYLQNTPTRTFLLDAFMAFLVVIGVIQFLYAVLFGNYPFNAFLSGFSAAVGQFVLTASLRMQTTEQIPHTASGDARKAAAVAKTKKIDAATGEGVEGGENGLRVSSERAFADFVFGSLILHAFCVNFIN